MAYFKKNVAISNSENNPLGKRKKWIIIGASSFLLLVAIIASGYVFARKAEAVLGKISSGKDGLYESIMRSIPGGDNEIVGEDEGQINIALLGMRGADDPNGGLLADTIMVASMRPGENKISIISIPRDLYVTDPGTERKSKLNAVHAFGEIKAKDQGMKDMEATLSEITGLNISYAATINFAGFTSLVDTIGGVNVHLDSPFSESVQFRGTEQRCNKTTFTIPSGNFETKTIHKKKNGVLIRKYKKQFPLCFAQDGANGSLDCGGDFTLPAGDNNLTGAQALCLVRSRDTTNDFERAKRQQLIMQAIKDKLLSAGTLTNPKEMSGVINNLSDNVRTDMQGWEMKRFYDLYKSMKNPQIYQRVLEISDEGLLYHPPNGDAGYILLPIGDNYDKIHEMVKNIFILPAQSDIKPK